MPNAKVGCRTLFRQVTLRSPATGRTRVRTLLLVPALALGATGCPGPTPPPGPPPATTGVNATATVQSGGAASCSGTLTWTYDLVSSTGTQGNPGPIRNSRSYNFPANANGQCAYTDGALGLRTGTWKVTVLNLSCTVALSPIAGDHPLDMNSCRVI